MDSIILFGCGLFGKKAYEKMHDEYNILAYCDNDRKKWGSQYFGIEIVSPEELKNHTDKMIVIAITWDIDKIVYQLREIGFDSIKLFQMYYDYELREQYQLVDRSKDAFFKNMNKASGGLCSRYVSCEYNRTQKNRERKKVLMIAYDFPPAEGGTEQRSVKFAKYLPKFGYDVTVCTIGYVDYNKTVNTKILEEVSGAKIIRIQKSPKTWQEITEEEAKEIFEIYKGITGEMDWFSDYLSDIRESDKKLIPEDSIIWVNMCLKELGKRIDLTDFDIVYTSSSPYSSAILGFYLKKLYGMKWVADFRDPWCENDYRNKTWYRDIRKHTFKYEKMLENNMIKDASIIVNVAEHNKRDFEKYGLENKVVSITNGYDETDFEGIDGVEYTKFTIAYVGSFYGKMFDAKPENWSKVITDMIDSREIEKTKLQWLFYGNIDNRAVESIKRNDKYGITAFYGSIPHRKALKAMCNADLLVGVGEYGEGAYSGWSSKFFEYLRAGKPILSFSSPYGVQHETLTEFDRGITVMPDEAERMREFIGLHYNKWCRGERNRFVHSDKYDRFERKSLTEQLADVFDKLIDD